MNDKGRNIIDYLIQSHKSWDDKFLHTYVTPSNALDLMKSFGITNKAILKMIKDSK